MNELVDINMQVRKTCGHVHFDNGCRMCQGILHRMNRNILDLASMQAETQTVHIQIHIDVIREEQHDT